MATVQQTLGHYEVLGTIGAGGMGEVFSARDPRLGRRVAIKMLPLRLASDRDTLSRFTQEARSASALNHPNIVTIHEVGAADGAPFIVMEFIDGDDLRAAIDGGPVSIRRALDIAAQIADGLGAAHDRGIVHRDLKPENVMITRDGFVKILDFGLAKITAAASGDGNDRLHLDAPGTNPGTILGTIGYMSPEQATGKQIDARSDQFAFGAILYELLTGRAAFTATNAIDTLSAILHADPQPVSRLRPQVPDELTAIVRRLLAKNPEDRYASTREVAQELRLLRDRVAAEESGFHRRPARHARQRNAAVIGAAGLIVVLGGSLWLSRDRAAVAPAAVAKPAQPAAKQYLAVTRFRDLTGDARGQLVVDGFAETLAARLGGYGRVQVMRTAQRHDASSDPAAVARDLGANLVLTGSMMRDGDRIRVAWSVVEPATRREWRDLVEGAASDLFAVQDQVADSVARQLELGAGPARAARDTAVSQQRYLEALGHLRRYDSDPSLDAAIEILEQLGSSPSVQAALARAYLYKFQNSREPRFAAIASRAAERALEGDPQSVDVNITVGELRRQTGQYAEAMQSFLRVLSQQPHNADAVLGLAETHKAAGDLAQAEAAYRRAIALQPNWWGGYNKLGAFFYINGRYADAIPLFQKVLELVPDNERGYNNLGGMYQRLGRYDDAVRVFRQSIARVPSPAGYSNLGTCYYFLGQFAEAAQSFAKATELAPHNFIYRRNLGDALRWIPGRERDAKAAFETAVELCDAAIEVNPADAAAHTSRAAALAKLGRDREARAAILRALELEPRDPNGAYEAAVVANIAGAGDEAVARLEQAVRLGFNPDDIARDPEFANLLKTGRLSAIVQRGVVDGERSVR